MEELLKTNMNEHISEKDWTALTKRVVKLLDKEIDELWFSCGWIVEDHEPYFKSLRNLDLQHIRESFRSAKSKVWDLWDESNISNFKEALERIEKARKV